MRREILDINYDDYFVAFIDVLGFSNLVEASPNDHQNKDLVKQFYKRAHQIFSDFKRIDTKRNIFTLAISDTIVLAIPAKSVNGSELDTLRELAIAVGRIQYDMARHHLWLRGGIAKGLCWINEEQNLIVGPAFLKAHNLEKNVAKFPRVVLDAELIRALNFETKSDFIEALNKLPEEIHHANWRTDCIFNWRRTEVDLCGPLPEDYPLFVDYLSPLKLDGNQGTLEIIMNCIESSLYNNVGYEKVKWVVLYLVTLLGARMRSNEFDVDFGDTINRLQRL